MHGLDSNIDLVSADPAPICRIEMIHVGEKKNVEGKTQTQQAI